MSKYQLAILKGTLRNEAVRCPGWTRYHDALGQSESRKFHFSQFFTPVTTSAKSLHATLTRRCRPVPRRFSLRVMPFRSGSYPSRQSLASPGLGYVTSSTWKLRRAGRNSPVTHGEESSVAAAPGSFRMILSYKTMESPLQAEHDFLPEGGNIDQSCQHSTASPAPK